MKVSELLENLKLLENYVPNSLYLKAQDDGGCVYKFLTNIKGAGYRKEFFITLDENESEITLLDKTVIDYIEIYPAQ